MALQQPNGITKNTIKDCIVSNIINSIKNKDQTSYENGLKRPFTSYTWITRRERNSSQKYLNFTTSTEYDK